MGVGSTRWLEGRLVLGVVGAKSRFGEIAHAISLSALLTPWVLFVALDSEATALRAFIVVSAIVEALHSGKKPDHPARDLLDLFKDCSMSVPNVVCQIPLLE